ncbi:LuxR C-terminal-related transcriptional regulator [Streptomyces sp. NPDC047009]
MPAPRPAAAAELLSEREVDVLRHLAEMLTAAEIDAEMFVSINTVSRT